MTRSLVFLGASVGLLTLSQAAPLELSTGTIDLPEGVLHKPDAQRVDGEGGVLLLPDGTSIRYEITGLGEPIPFTFNDGSRPLKEAEHDGRRFYSAVIARSAGKELVVIFPTWSPTYFNARAKSDEELERAKRVVLRFVPKRK